jgi:hypothetical protein
MGFSDPVFTILPGGRYQINILKSLPGIENCKDDKEIESLIKQITEETVEINKSWISEAWIRRVFEAAWSRTTTYVLVGAEDGGQCAISSPGYAIDEPPEYLDGTWDITICASYYTTEGNWPGHAWIKYTKVGEEGKATAFYMSMVDKFEFGFADYDRVATWSRTKRIKNPRVIRQGSTLCSEYAYMAWHKISGEDLEPPELALNDNIDHPVSPRQLGSWIERKNEEDARIREERRRASAETSGLLGWFWEQAYYRMYGGW